MSESVKIENTSIQTLIRLVSAGAKGESVNDLQVDWPSVMSLAAEQNVEVLIACALLHSPEIACPAPLRAYLLNCMRTESAANLIRKARILALLDDLKLAGIEAQILKGYAVSRVYKYPESRKSVDTDLFISIEQEEKCAHFFREQGFRVDPRPSTSHHTICQHPKLGMVELHISLYAELVRDVWFQDLEDVKNVTEAPLQVNDPEGSFETLGHTDQLIFLTLHMVKHFILDALTLRMMLDLAMYFAHNRAYIDASRFWNIMEKLRYRKLVSSVLWTMVQFGGFHPEEFPGLSPEAPEEIHRILEDMLEDGYLGFRQKDQRQESGMEYNRQLQLKDKSQGQYMWYMLIHKFRGSMKAMFPALEQLKRKYPVIKKYRIAIPCVRLYHAFSYALRKLCMGSLQRDIHSENSTQSEIVKKRMRLFKSLDML